MNIELEREEDGRWVAEVPDLPGAMVYRQTREEALAKVEALALRILADRIEYGENGSRTQRNVRRPSMNRWPPRKARLVLTALTRIGWRIKRRGKGSYRLLERPGWPDDTFAFHAGEEIGPRMMARIARGTGLTPEDL